jgi:hypothetical protein
MHLSPITRAYDSHAEAERAQTDLIAAGVPEGDISIISRAADGSVDKPTEADPVATGATVGTLIGGGLGTLAGLGAMAIPGVGPIVAAGWVVAMLTGAGAGAAAGAGAGAAASGLFTTLHHSGMSEEDANLYAESVTRGGSLVMVRSDDAAKRATAESVLSRSGHVDVALRSQEWRDKGWVPGSVAAPEVDTRARYGS